MREEMSATDRQDPIRKTLKQVQGDAATVYIAGKVTGLHYHYAKLQFDFRAAELRAMGYIVINPMEVVPKDTDWQQAMKICIVALITSDYIDLLPNWKDSNGAILEMRLARKLGIKLFKS